MPFNDQFTDKSDFYKLIPAVFCGEARVFAIKSVII